MPISVPHPFDLEIQDFSSYGLILDLRRQDEWLVGNIPGALCRPAISADNERAVDDLIRHGRFDDIELIKRQMVSDQIDATIESIMRQSVNGHVLVYCARGGYRSQYASEALTLHGLKVDVLRGGWVAYRQWAQASLDTLFMMLDWLPPQSLASASYSEDVTPQILNIDAIVTSPRLQMFQDFDGRIPRSIFESEVLETLRQFDRNLPVYFSPVTLTHLLPTQLPAGLIRVMRHLKSTPS